MSIVGLIGLSLLLGSFFNVVIYRLPLMLFKQWREECQTFLNQDIHQIATDDTLNLMWPASHCVHCKTPIKYYDNIPILGYLLLRGRCRQCKERILLRYPLIEILTASLTVFVWFQFTNPIQCGAAIIFTYLLLLMTMIDFDHQIIPDQLSLGGLWLGLLINTHTVFCSLTESVYGAVLGYLCLWIIYQVFKLLTGKEGMGHGDFKLLAMLGAWLGTGQLLFIVLTSSILGSIVGILLIVKGQSKEVPFAFGPYLAIAGFVALIAGNPITSWYLQHVAF